MKNDRFFFDVRVGTSSPLLNRKVYEEIFSCKSNSKFDEKQF